MDSSLCSQRCHLCRSLGSLSLSLPLCPWRLVRGEQRTESRRRAEGAEGEHRDQDESEDRLQDRGCRVQFLRIEKCFRFFSCFLFICRTGRKVSFAGPRPFPLTKTKRGRSKRAREEEAPRLGAPRKPLRPFPSIQTVQTVLVPSLKSGTKGKERKGKEQTEVSEESGRLSSGERRGRIGSPPPPPRPRRRRRRRPLGLINLTPLALALSPPFSKIHSAAVSRGGQTERARGRGQKSSEAGGTRRERGGRWNCFLVIDRDRIDWGFRISSSSSSF